MGVNALTICEKHRGVTGEIVRMVAHLAMAAAIVDLASAGHVVNEVSHVMFYPTTLNIELIPGRHKDTIGYLQSD